MVELVFRFSLLRRSEWICVAYFASVAILSFSIRVPPRRRGRVVGVNVAVVAGLFLLPQAVPFVPRLFISVVRDWLPAPLILLGYHEAGHLVVPRADKFFEKAFLHWDDYLFRMRSFRFLKGRLPDWVDAALEFAYLQCYVIVPSGIAVLYLAHQGRAADSYWSIVLPAVFTAYGLTPLFPSQPPRKLQEETYAAGDLPWLRKVNLWVHDHASIKFNTFPSGHVAGALSASLAILKPLPTVGICYMVIAVGILLGSVRGRYHYGVDAAAGLIVAVASYLCNMII